MNQINPKVKQVLAQRLLARRRLLEFTKLTHGAYLPGWVHEDICTRLERFSDQVEQGLSPRLMLLMPPRHGKLLADDTLVLTKGEGWKMHGDVEIGDQVLNHKGQWIDVIGVSKPALADCEVVTTAGTRIYCHRNHEWAVEEYCQKGHKVDRWSYVERVVETREFLKFKETHEDMRAANHGRNQMRRFYLPRLEIDDFPFEVLMYLRHIKRPPYGGRLAIADVRVLPMEERVSGKCIHVNSPDGIYLITRDLVPTHNSELASTRFPAWHLGRLPQHEIINCSYNLDLPMKFSRRVRAMLRDPTYTVIFPDCQLDPDSQSAEAWNTTQGGGFTAAGVGGGITGKGAHILIIDDPLKNQEEADSIQTRDKLWDWYQSTAYTRLAPGGGVLVIECMTGDTPVLMADHTEKRLDLIQAGEEVATYKAGKLTSSVVTAQKSSGHDCCFTITMSSGRVVEANARHPFLVYEDGELQWTRLRNLHMGQKIVALKGNGVNGGVRSVQPTAVTNPLSAEDIARLTTIKNDGLMDTAPPPSTPLRAATRILSTVMGSLQKITTGFWNPKTAGAPYVSNPRKALTSLLIGKESSASIMTTTQELCGGFSVTAAISPLDLPKTLEQPLPWPSTSDFVLDEVVSIIASGEKEVFDLQIADTANFIANGLVAHNTWWHDDDLAGRLLEMMKKDPDADQFEVIKYPALSETYEYRDEHTLEIIRSSNPLKEASNSITLLRPPDTCLHEARYPTKALKRIKANLQPRIWSALYQQNPVPAEGMYFTKDMFRFLPALPSPHRLHLYTAWDFAIGERQQNDWTVGVTLLQDHNDILYILEVVRLKGGSFQIIEEILDVAQKWGGVPDTGYMIGAEDGQIWRSIEPFLLKRMQERKLYPAYEVMKPLTDKMARARPLQGRMQHGHVVFPEHAPWKDQVVSEMLRFPAGVHDDVVDALSWAVRLCMNKEPPSLKEPKKLKSWRDKMIADSGAGSHMVA